MYVKNVSNVQNIQPGLGTYLPTVTYGSYSFTPNTTRGHGVSFWQVTLWRSRWKFPRAISRNYAKRCTRQNGKQHPLKLTGTNSVLISTETGASRGLCRTAVSQARG